MNDEWEARRAAIMADLAEEMAECPECTGTNPSRAYHIAVHPKPPVCTVCFIIAPYGFEFCPSCGVELVPKMPGEEEKAA